MLGCLNAEIYTLEPEPDNAGGGIMKIIKFFIIIFFFISKAFANNEDLIIYTYDSFVSEWGPGPLIKQTFEERNDVEIEFFGSESAATLLAKLALALLADFASRF